MQYRVTRRLPHGSQQRTIAVTGPRNIWALEQLIKVGPKGLTAIENPAPRVSAYIHNLRKLGLHIKTVYEPHGGEYAGTHARYFLLSEVQRVGRHE